MGDYSISFYGILDEFDGIRIGKGIEGEVWGEYLSIESDRLYVYDAQNQKVVIEYPCKMEFKDYLAVNIKSDLNGDAKIEIRTNGDSFVETVPWVATNGTIFAECLGDSIIHDCILSYYCNGWNKDIWMYGDSYFDMTRDDRWTSYVLKDGNEQVMLTARSGKGSRESLDNLKKQLQFGTPSEIIWCMGMNDGDENGKINSEYLECLQEVEKICEANDIELVLATIPTCPYWLNDYKNEYVKNSGYRYIDFALAVGAYDNKEWYDNMLENTKDRIHPTVEGAKSLYEIAITSAPEICGR